MGELTLREWLQERLDNTHRLAAIRPDRAAWLEDGEYFKAAVELEAENQRLQAEVEQARTDRHVYFSKAAELVEELQAANLAREQEKERADANFVSCERIKWKLSDTANELKAANLAHEQYREWAAGQVRQAKAALREAEYLLRDSEHLDARIERYFEAKKKP